MSYLYVALAVVVSYCIGSISFAVIVSKLFTQKDVRNFGSGNAGMTNVMRVAGVAPGLITFVLDVAKSYLSCYIGWSVFEHLSYNPLYGAWVCGVSCLFGHVFPVFFKFRGGKAVASGFGLLLFCCPLSAAISISVFIIIALITKIVSIGSILGTLAAFITCVAVSASPYPDAFVTLFSAIMTLLIIIKHKENIIRILKGEEKKFKAHK